MTTARIFRALVPKLREGGIRTLAEAMAACRGLTSELDKQHRAGWVEALEAPGRLDRDALKSIDTYPYRHRVRDVMHATGGIHRRRRALERRDLDHDPAAHFVALYRNAEDRRRQAPAPRRPASSPSATFCARLRITAPTH